MCIRDRKYTKRDRQTDRQTDRDREILREKELGLTWYLPSRQPFWTPVIKSVSQVSLIQISVTSLSDSNQCHKSVWFKSVSQVSLIQISVTSLSDSNQCHKSVWFKSVSQVSLIQISVTSQSDSHSKTYEHCIYSLTNENLPPPCFPWLKSFIFKMNIFEKSISLIFYTGYCTPFSRYNRTCQKGKNQRSWVDPSGRH